MHIITLYFRKLKYQTKLLVGPIHLGKPLEPTKPRSRRHTNSPPSVMSHRPLHYNKLGLLWRNHSRRL